MPLASSRKTRDSGDEEASVSAIHALDSAVLLCRTCSGFKAKERSMSVTRISLTGLSCWFQTTGNLYLAGAAALLLVTMTQ